MRAHVASSCVPVACPLSPIQRGTVAVNTARADASVASSVSEVSHGFVAPMAICGSAAIAFIAWVVAETTARACSGCSYAHLCVVMIDALTSGVDEGSKEISRMSRPARRICTESLFVKPTTASTCPDARAACCV